MSRRIGLHAIGFKEIAGKINLTEQVRKQQRCYCGHRKVKHLYGGDGGCNEFKCVCDKFEPLPYDFFQNCPCYECNSTYFYQDDNDDFLFHCHACERSFRFDGRECFDEV